MSRVASRVSMLLTLLTLLLGSAPRAAAQSGGASPLTICWYQGIWKNNMGGTSHGWYCEMYDGNGTLIASWTSVTPISQT